MSRNPDPPDAEAPVEVPARLVLFGYEDTEATVRLRPRSRSWRVGGSARTLGVTLLVAPLLALVPPHAPWLIGALAGGGYLVRRRWTERFTVLEVVGTCPRCGGSVHANAGRLAGPHAVVCDACRHQASAVIAEGALRSAGTPET